jgi:hypothetical protein
MSSLRSRRLEREQQLTPDESHNDRRLKLALPEQQWMAALHYSTLPDPQLQHFPLPGILTNG